jgi:hypothetical protein
VRPRAAAVVALSLAGCVAGAVASAHSFEPASVEATRTGEGWRLVWRERRGAQAEPLPVGLVGCAPAGGVSRWESATASWASSTFVCAEAGPTRLEVGPLVASHGSVVVREGAEPPRLVTASRPWTELAGAPARRSLDVVSALRLGAEHVAAGWDHLVFVALLVVWHPHWRAAAVRVTAFTVGHSASLAAAVLGLVSLPAPLVEAAIAWSVVVVAAAILLELRGRERGRAGGEAWSMAALFGLVHGLGFASAFEASGYAGGSLAAALAGFNLGIELAQLGFVAALLLASSALSRVAPGLLRQRARAGLALLGGLAGSWWLASRL